MKTVTFSSEEQKKMTIHRGEETTDPETGEWWGTTICGKKFRDVDYVDTDYAEYHHELHYCKKCYA